MNREDGSKQWLAYRYERLSDFCYLCGRIDHTESACTLSSLDDAHPDDPRSQFGPWLRGQSMGISKSPANRTIPRTKTTSGRAPADSAVRIHPPLSHHLSHDTPLLKFHQNRPPLPEISTFHPTISRQHTPPSLTLHPQLDLGQESGPSQPSPTEIHLSSISPTGPTVKPILTTKPSCGPHVITPLSTLHNPPFLDQPQSQPTLLSQQIPAFPLSQVTQPKRKSTQSDQRVCKFAKNEVLESLHAAMDRMQILPPHDPGNPSLNIQQSEEVTMHEESVTITCRRLIHVKRQARKIGLATSDAQHAPSAGVRAQTGKAGRDLSSPPQ